jgi:hypothetical protein
MAIRIFLSFSEDDTARLKALLEDLVHPDYELDFYAGPFPEDFESEEARQVKKELGEKIVKSNFTLCLIGENTHKSKWVNCMLEKSRNKGNRIIAMAFKKVESAILPEVIRQENLKFYPWHPEKLVQLIGEGDSNTTGYFY